jgi:hypothetical protein
VVSEIVWNAAGLHLSMSRVGPLGTHHGWNEPDLTDHARLHSDLPPGLPYGATPRVDFCEMTNDDNPTPEQTSL